MELNKYIKEILINRDNVIVSGFGAFEKSHNSASIDPVTKEMRPPFVALIFRPELKTDSGVLSKYVAEKEEISEEKAAELIQIQVTEWEVALNSGQKLTLDLLGILSKDHNGQYFFESSVQASDFPESYGLASIPILEKNTIELPPNKKTEDKIKPEKKIPEKKIPIQKKKIEPVKKNVIPGEQKSHKKLIWGLIIGVPVAALIVLGVIYSDVVKQKFNSVSSYLSSKPKSNNNNSTIDTLVRDSLNVADSINVETKAILENYTVVNAETNSRIDTKVEQLENIKKVYIIAGSYKDQRHAIKQKGKLDKKGFVSEILPVNNGLYRVSIASFDDIKSAASDFNRIKSIDESLNVWILVNK